MTFEKLIGIVPWILLGAVACIILRTALMARRRACNPIVEEHTQLIGSDLCEPIPLPGIGQYATDFEAFNQDLWAYRPYLFSNGFTREEAEKLYDVMCRAREAAQAESERAHE